MSLRTSGCPFTYQIAPVIETSISTDDNLVPAGKPPVGLHGNLKQVGHVAVHRRFVDSELLSVLAPSDGGHRVPAFLEMLDRHKHGSSRRVQSKPRRRRRKWLKRTVLRGSERVRSNY